MNRIVFLFLAFFTITASSQASDKYYEINDEVWSSYEDILSLNMSDARATLKELKQSQPNSYSTLHLANYIDLLELVISEKEWLYNRKLLERTARINEIESNKEGKSSPYHYYVLGEIHLQWALIKFKFHDYYAGFRDASKAYRYFKKNVTLHPEFILNNKGIGTIETLVGVVPENLRWGVKLLGGLEGNIHTGLAKLQQTYQSLEQNDLFKKETGIIYAYLLLHYGNKKDASWNVINELELNVKNPTELFIKSNIAHYVGKNDLTIQMLSNYQKKPGSMPFHYLNYMLGVAKLNRLDDDADQYLLAYVNNFNGDNFIKDGYLRLAWHALIQGDIIKYDHFIQKVRSEGNTDINFDKTAQRYAKEKQVPNAALLKARLLYDGSYFNQADELLSVLKKYTLKSAKDKLEYTYRLGRIRQQLSKHKEAIKLFKETIETGRYDKSHYACNSALQMGLIYESLNDKKSAIEAYKSCLSINPADYKQSLHHRAKVGIQRLR